MDFQWLTFSGLNTKQLYDILSLRSKVFVVEQNCVFLDADGLDSKAIHLLGIEDNILVGYLRLFPPGNIESALTFGRLVTDKTVRSKGYGRQLIQEMLHYCSLKYPNIAIKCSAQHYLTNFYESFGFKAYGKPYDEDGIIHIAMGL